MRIYAPLWGHQTLELPNVLSPRMSGLEEAYIWFLAWSNDFFRMNNTFDHHVPLLDLNGNRFPLCEQTTVGSNYAESFGFRGVERATILWANNKVCHCRD